MSSNGSIYFISDLHLDESRPEVTNAFERFLGRVTDADALYILGDLFEFWIGDDDDAPIVERVANMLRHYSASNPNIYFMHGNRDFLLGERFAARAGAKILNDPTILPLGDQRAVLLHGDSLCTRDEEYQQFRLLARSTDWQSEMLQRSLEERRQLAQLLRNASKDAGSRKAQDIMDVTGTEVTRVMQENECAIMIHGHTHRPARHEIETGTRWVLGDWEESGWFLRYQDGEFELVDFDINQ